MIPTSCSMKWGRLKMVAIQGQWIIHSCWIWSAAAFCRQERQEESRNRGIHLGGQPVDRSWSGYGAGPWCFPERHYHKRRHASQQQADKCSAFFFSPFDSNHSRGNSFEGLGSGEGFKSTYGKYNTATVDCSNGGCSECRSYRIFLHPLLSSLSSDKKLCAFRDLSLHSRRHRSALLSEVLLIWKMRSKIQDQRSRMVNRPVMARLRRS